MWIKIANKRINFDNVVHYSMSETKKRKPFNGEETDEVEYKVWIETINETDEYGGLVFKYDTKIEARGVIKELDSIIGISDIEL